jgi:hypothetical protein
MPWMWRVIICRASSRTSTYGCVAGSPRNSATHTTGEVELALARSKRTCRNAIGQQGAELRPFEH